MADAYLKVKDNGASGLELVREEADDAKNALGVTDLAISDYIVSGNKFAQFEPGGISLPEVGEVADIETRTTPESWFSCVVECSEGDKFVVNAVGGGTITGGKRCSAWLNSDREVISMTARDYTRDNAEITAPSGAHYLVVNTKASSEDYYVIYGSKNNGSFLAKGAHYSSEIKPGDDCDDLAPGTHFCANGTNAPQIYHTPFTNSGYILYCITVTKLSGRIAQIAIQNNTESTIKIRNSVGGFGEWKDITSSNLTKQYIIDGANIAANRVRNVVNAKSLTMIGVSDAHYRYNDAGIINALRDMSNAVKEIGNQVFVEYYVCYGDSAWVWDGDVDFENNEKAMAEITKLISSGFSDTRQIRLVGNHDPNSVKLSSDGKYFTMDNLFSFFGKYNNVLNRPENHMNGGYGYLDDDFRKIRVICLNTSDFSDRTNSKPVSNNGNYYMSDDQIAWFADKLDLSEKSDASSWQIIIMSHMPLDQQTMAQDAYANILYAYETGGSGTLKGVSYNFSGKNAAKLALYIHGHTHSYVVDNHHYMSGNTFPTMKLPRICIPNALPGRDAEETETDSNGIDWGNGETYPKTADTVESTAFVVNTVDPVSMIVYSHHYGAGIDRILHYNSETVTANKTFTPSIAATSWETLDNGIATVSDGTVTPVASGNVLIYARADDGTREYWNIAVSV